MSKNTRFHSVTKWSLTDLKIEHGRAMLKRAAKEYKKHVKHLSPAILRQLEARQLALKYVANVTYGKHHWFSYPESLRNS